MPRTLSPSLVGAVAPARRQRTLGLACDDPAAALPWRHALADEGLLLQDWPWVAAPLPVDRADALVLFLARGVTEQLGRLREFATRRPELPIIVVCRALRELDHVLALEMGADDVLEAGWGPTVAAARLRALWRRSRPSADPSPVLPDELHFGRLSLLRRERCVLRAGRPIDFTEGEFELLWRLALQAGQAVPRQALLRELRGFFDDAAPDRSIDSRVYRIRGKLGERGDAPQRIRTIRNCGYLFSPMPD